jgi:UDP-N-acetylmuramoyl-tripeptide--D-alanyl-D-alanine ligase
MRVIGLTGSSGKTSTKEMLAAVLSTKFLVTKTEGNLNNHLGVPLTLLEANSTDMFGVVEMGMNHPGEIRPLAEMAAPEIGVITNIGVAHIEYMGSREGIAREKGELLRALPSGGIGVFPAEDDFAHVLREMAPGAVITVGFWSGDVRAADIVATDCGMRFAATFAGETVQGEIPVPGRHMVMNGLLAVAAGIGAGVPFADAVRALGETKLTGGRLEIRTFEGAKLINDAYNSNPMSAIAALRTLHEMPGSGRRIAVMGRMGELGHEAENGHRDVGRAVAELGIDQLIGVGTEAGWMVEEARLNPATRAVLVADAREAAQLLRQEVSAGDIVLFKGSRSARIERVLQLLENPEEEVS